MIQHYLLLIGLQLYSGTQNKRTKSQDSLSIALRVIFLLVRYIKIRRFVSREYENDHSKHNYNPLFFLHRFFIFYLSLLFIRMAAKLIPVGIDLGSLHARVAIGDPITLESEAKNKEKISIPNVIANAQGSRFTVALSVEEQTQDGGNHTNKSFIFGEAARRHLSREKKVIDHHLVRYLCSQSNAEEENESLEACSAFFANLVELACDASTSTSVQPSQLRIVISLPPSASEQMKEGITKSLEQGLRQLVRKKEGKKMEKKTSHQILVGVVSDPSAAALAYGLVGEGHTSLSKDTKNSVMLSNIDTKETKNKFKNTLVIDWGATGLTLTHLKQTQSSSHPLLTTPKTHTEPQCAGSFIISALVAHCASLLERKHSSMIQRGSVMKHARAVTKLITACEIAVKTLSRTNVAQIAVDGVYEGLDLNCSLSKPRFEMLCGKVLRLAEKTMTDFVGSEKFDVVLMSGNVCQMPKAETLIEKLFPGDVLLRASKAVEGGLKIPVDESVAIGCARYAQQFLLGEQQKERILDENGDLLPSSIAEESKKVETLVPLCPIAIGVRSTVSENSVQTLIDVGSPLPAHISKVIKTGNDTDLEPFSIIQIIGSDSSVCDRTLAEIENIPPGTKELELTLELSEIGKLSLALNGGDTIVV